LPSSYFRILIVVFSFFGKKPPAPKQFAVRRSRPAPSPVIAAVGDGELDAITVGRGLRLEIGASGLDPCVEQAAILFAADHQAEARAVLEAALQPGEAPEECWFMLLELHELHGERQRYQALALKYAARFQKSPPSPRPAVAPAAATGMVAAVPQGGRRLAGHILAAGAESFSFLLAPSGAEVEIDASQLQRMDFVSAGILLNTMLALQQAGKRVRILQLSHLVAALLASVGIGRIAALETRKY